MEEPIYQVGYISNYGLSIFGLGLTYSEARKNLKDKIKKEGLMMFNNHNLEYYEECVYGSSQYFERCIFEE